MVIILAIISAIALPRIGRASAGSGEAALLSDLRMMRQAIDTFAVEHHNEFPCTRSDGAFPPSNPLVFVHHLTNYTDRWGQASGIRSSTKMYGPYLQSIPPLPVGSNAGATSVSIDLTNAAPTVAASTFGWVYCARTGVIIANSDEVDSGGVKRYSEY